MSIIYALISKNCDSDFILSEFSTHHGNFCQIMRILLTKIKASKNTSKFREIKYCTHYNVSLLIENNLYYLILSENTVSTEIIFSLIFDIKNKLLNTYNYNDIMNQIQIKEFNYMLKQIIEYYNEQIRLKNLNEKKLYKINKNLIVKENIENYMKKQSIYISKEIVYNNSGKNMYKFKLNEIKDELNKNENKNKISNKSNFLKNNINNNNNNNNFYDTSNNNNNNSNKILVNNNEKLLTENLIEKNNYIKKTEFKRKLYSFFFALITLFFLILTYFIL